MEIVKLDNKTKIKGKPTSNINKQKNCVSIGATFKRSRKKNGDWP